MFQCYSIGCRDHSDAAKLDSERRTLFDLCLHCLQIPDPLHTTVEEATPMPRGLARSPWRRSWEQQNRKTDRDTVRQREGQNRFTDICR